MRAGLRRFARNRMALAGSVVIFCVFLLTITAPFLFPQGAFSLAGQPLQPPSLRFPLGTDALGRDVAAGVAEGARTSLLIGISAALSAVLFGAAVGGIAGYYRGPIDLLLMRVTEFFQTIPAFLLAMLLVVILSPSLLSVIIAIAAVSWPGIARLVRGEFVALGGREFILASAGLGANGPRIIFRHLLPNAITPAVVYWMTDMALAILLGSSLGYLGLGAQPPTSEWGVQIAEGKNFMGTAWWISVFPGIAIVLTGLGFSLTGDGLAEILRTKK